MRSADVYYMHLLTQEVIYPLKSSVHAIVITIASGNKTRISLSAPLIAVRGFGPSNMLVAVVYLLTIFQSYDQPQPHITMLPL
jgi:hypothetical protein